MIRKISAGVALVAAATLTSAAVGQSAPVKDTPQSERGVGANREFSGKLDEHMLYTEPDYAAAAYNRALLIANCMVGANEELARNSIGGPGTGDIYFKKLEKSLRGKFRACNREGAVLPLALINGALAEKLIVGSDNTLNDRAKAVNVDEAQSFQDGDSPGQVSLESIARCLAVYSPGLTYKVLASGVNTPDEDAALQKLYGSSPECGVAAPPKQITYAIQRIALSVALFEWTSKS